MAEIVADSKKQAAFRLFEEGKTPLDPEVRALGLKSTTRANYYYLWREGKGIAAEGPATINETKREPPPPTGEKEPSDIVDEPADDSEEEPGEAKEVLGESKEKRAKKEGEGVSSVSEAVAQKDGDGKTKGPEIKMATTIADDGIKCTVFLSLQTLSLYRIAASTQAQVNGGEKLTLGDFLDACAEDFFRVRGKKLGLVQIAPKGGS